MPLVADGVSIPIEAVPNQQSFNAAQKAIQATNKAQNEANKLLDERKAKVKADGEVFARAEAAKQKAIQATTQALNKQREQMEKLTNIGRQMAVTGAAIFGAAALAAKNFVDKADEADMVANRWKRSTDKISEAQLKLGREVADTLNPAYAQLADTLDKVVGTLNQNPAVLSGLLQMGGTLLAGGTAVAATANIAKQLATLGTLTGNAGLGQAAGALGKVSEIALYATTVVLAAEAGLAIGNAIQKALGVGQGRESWADVLQTFLDIPPAMLTIFQNGMNAILAKLGIKASLNIPVVRANIPGSQAFTPRAPEVGGRSPDERGERPLTESQRDAIDRAKKATEAAQKEADRREALTHDRNMKLLEAQKTEAQREADIRRSMSETTRQFLQDDADQQKDYYNRRMDMAKKFGTEARRAEEDHQKRIRQIERDSKDRILQLAQERDALGLVRAKRDTERQRQDETENYKTEQKRRNQDFAEQIHQMDRDYSIMRERRMREYQFKMQAYQAEVQAAQQAYQAIVNSILQLRRSADAIWSNGIESSRNFAGAAPVNTTSTTTNGTATVNINGGALSVSQTQAMINTSVQTAVMQTLARAI